jgi:hypothetical protein
MVKSISNFFTAYYISSILEDKSFTYLILLTKITERDIICVMLRTN